MSNNNSRAVSVQFKQETRLPEMAQARFSQIGENSNREGLKKTPERFAKAMAELTRGYSMTGLDAIGEGILGLSKIGRVVDVFAKRLSKDELGRMPQQLEHSVRTF